MKQHRRCKHGVRKGMALGQVLGHGALFCLLLPLFFLFLAVHCAPWAIAAEPTRVVYGFDREFPPFSYEEAGGEATGFEVDVLKAIFDRPDVVLSMRPLAWENVQLELSSGSINITSGMVQTKQREKMFLFADKPTLPLQIRLFTKIYERVPNATLLRGRMVSVEQGSYQHRLLEKFGGINIKPFQGKTAPIKALYNDEVSAYCGPVQTAYFYINKLNYGAITTVGTPLGITEMRFAVNRGRGDILRMVDEGLNDLVSSGEYDRLYRKWFVRELEDLEVKLLQQSAQKASISAYSPYEVVGQGAAVLTTTGKIFTACTVENAMPSASVTALQAAVSKAVSEGEYELRAALITDTKGTLQEFSPDELQFLYEFGRGVLVMLPNGEEAPQSFMVAQKLGTPVIKQLNQVETE